MRLCIMYSFQCPPCRSFTPQLVQAYKTLKESGQAFEIIFLTSDRSEDGFNEYFKEMPWLAVPYGNERVKELSGLFSVQGKYFKKLRDNNINYFLISNEANISRG